MLIDFDSLAGTSRVWVYQSNRPITDEESLSILNNAHTFVNEWTAHQAGLKAGVKLFHNYFLVFSVDESYNDASGCSIDKKVAFIKSQEQQTGISFFDRMTVAYQSENGQIEQTKLHELDSLLASGKITLATPVFNNLVSSMDEFRSHWKTPLRDSWMMRFITSSTPSSGK